jgi:hypothetical protein
MARTVQTFAYLLALHLLLWLDNSSMAAFGERSEDKIAQIFFQKSPNYIDLVLGSRKHKWFSMRQRNFFFDTMATAAFEAGSRPDRTDDNNMNS